MAERKAGDENPTKVTTERRSASEANRALKEASDKQTAAAKAIAEAEEAGRMAMEAGADVFATTSSDAAHSTYEENPDPNPLGLRPEPGPSTIQTRGEPKDG